VLNLEVILIVHKSKQTNGFRPRSCLTINRVVTSHGRNYVNKSDTGTVKKGNNLTNLKNKMIF